MKDITKKSWKGKAVRVDWVDSMQTSGWCDYKPVDMSCSTIGHYYAERTDRIVLALNLSYDENTYGNYMEIPRCAITKITRLKE